jgi:hypothetical protein
VLVSCAAFGEYRDGPWTVHPLAVPPGSRGVSGDLTVFLLNWGVGVDEQCGIDVFYKHETVAANEPEPAPAQHLDPEFTIMM